MPSNRKAAPAQPLLLQPDHNPTTAQRASLDQSVEFRRYIEQKRRTTQHERERLAAEVETLEATIQGKLAEIAEHDEILLRCEAALTIDVSARRPAPRLTPRQEG